MLGGRFTLRTAAEGPLDAGADRQLTLPLRAQDKGAAWGSLTLRRNLCCLCPRGQRRARWDRRGLGHG